MAFGNSPGGGLQRAARVLATADAVAHAALFTLFVWRTITGSGFRLVQSIFALLAGLGFGAGFVGSMLIRYGGRTKARTLGLYCIAASTALAGALLVMANWSGD
ncbi:hypothetical protein [Pendulispora albinea]|uniref:Major facilitator superfamily (MFS) profile domain-containing protein n=1 Tax=Pendulispora albinea TaxID=2741071 RepID=A0ABZ2M957_9BACT